MEAGMMVLPCTRTSRVPYRQRQVSAVSSIDKRLGGGCQVLRGLTVACLIEAMLLVAMRREDGDLVSALLQRDSCIDDQTLGAAYAEVGVEKDGMRLFWHCIWSAQEVCVAGGHDMRSTARDPTIPLSAVVPGGHIELPMKQRLHMTTPYVTNRSNASKGGHF